VSLALARLCLYLSAVGVAQLLDAASLAAVTVFLPGPLGFFRPFHCASWASTAFEIAARFAKSYDRSKLAGFGGIVCGIIDGRWP